MTQRADDDRFFSAKVRDVFSGIASGVSKVAVGHPFDTIKVRLQTEGAKGRFNGPLHALSVTIRTEGIRGLYKGAFPPLVGFGATDSLMVVAYMRARRWLHSDSGPEPISNIFIAGGIGGIACTVICTPMELIKAKLQVQYADPSTKRYAGSLDCARQLIRNHGISGLYIGLVPTLMFRSFVSVYFGSYELFKRSLSSSPLPPWACNFVSGGLGATVMWIIAFPTDVIKNRLQAQPDWPVEQRKYKGTIDCIRQILATDGWRGFYRGFTPCLLRSFPTNGAAFMALELVAKYFP